MTEINISGMSCGHCVSAVTKALEELGLSDVSVSLEQGKASFKTDDSVSLDSIKEAIEDIGFDVV